MSVLPPELQSLLEGDSRLLRRGEDGVPLGVAGVPDVPAKPAMDSRLRQCGHDMGAFLSELFDLGAIEPCSSASVRERAGLFFVSKKDSKLRLIWDTRRSNAHFEPPAFTTLPSGESLAALEALQAAVEQFEEIKDPTQLMEGLDA